MKTLLRRWLLPILISLIGFVLRLYQLGDHNVWWDEAYSAWLARKPISEILTTTAFDVHPPLYYLTLGGWMRLVGDSEFAIRYVGLMAGLLTIAVVYALGRRLGGRAWGSLGAFLLAISRFHVWWSQETRMYILAVLWITLVLYIILRQVDARQRVGGWAAYALIAAAGLYTLYLAALAMVAAGAAVLLLWATRRFSWRDVLAFSAASLGALVLYLPWILFAADKVRSGAATAPFTPLDVVNLYSLLLSAGISSDIRRYWLIALIYGVMLIASLMALLIRRRWDAIAILLPGLLLPPLIIYQFTWLNWRFYSPAPEARYFLLFSPIIMLIPAAGIVMLYRWQRWIGTAALLALIGLSAWSLPPYYAARHMRDQWKSASQAIDAYARTGDVIVMVSADRYPEFLYEYERFGRNALPVRGVPGGIPMLTAESVDDQMRGAVQNAERVWLVEIAPQIQDPSGLARAWLDDHSKAVLTVNYEFDNRLTLFDSSGDAPELALEAGEPLAIHEYWPMDVVHLGVITDEGEHLVEMVHESGMVISTRTIDSDNAARHDVPFLITSATPHGNYIFRADGIEIASALVTHSDPLWSESDVPNRVDAAFANGISLLGYDISPAQPRAGQNITLDLFWTTSKEVSTSYTVFVQIVGAFNPATNSALWGQHDGQPVYSTFPITDWPIGLIVRDSHEILFDAGAQSGEYTIIVGMYDPATGQRLALPGSADNALVIATIRVP